MPDTTSSQEDRPAESVVTSVEKIEVSTVEISSPEEDINEVTTASDVRFTETAITRSRSKLIGEDLRSLSLWSLRFIFVAIAAFLFYKIVGMLWVGILPTLLAILVCSALWPPVSWLIRHKVPSWLASLLVLGSCIAIVSGILSAIAPHVAKEIGPLSQKAILAVQQLQGRLMEPPFNVNQHQLNDLAGTVTEKIQNSASQIASIAINGVGAAGSFLVTLIVTLMLCFFFLKDGRGLLPFIDRVVGAPASNHIAEVLTRCWQTLGGFIRTQGLVSAIDATLIGAGLLICHVPLAGPLAIITFLGGFIPIVGAFVAGFLSIAVAIVGVNFKTGVIVLIIVLVVQQLEGNVLSPILQSNAMSLHPVIVLLAVSAGGTLYGIMGAFLAVPIMASLAVLLRYLVEQWDERAAITHDEHSHDEDKKEKAWAEWLRNHSSRLRSTIEQTP